MIVVDINRREPGAIVCAHCELVIERIHSGFHAWKHVATGVPECRLFASPKESS
jgi:hypothetical protein